MNRISITIISVMIAATVSAGRERPDAVTGNLWQFNDNGGWSLYLDERAVIDIVKNKLLTGSVACSLGAGGAERSGNVEAVVSDLATGSMERFILHPADPDTFRSDDRHAPAFILRPDSKYLAIYAPFSKGTGAYYRIATEEMWVTWADEMRFVWPVALTGSTGFSTAYANPVYLSSEKIMYNFVTGNNGSANFMLSRDSGSTWTYGGQLLKSAGTNPTGVNYFKFCGNGLDRIDIFASERRTPDTSAGMYHGYTYCGALFNSSGTSVDGSIVDTTGVSPVDQLTKVFPGDTLSGGGSVWSCRSIDIQRYPDDTIAAVVMARSNGPRGGTGPAADSGWYLIYCRFDGGEWKTARLAKIHLKSAAAQQEPQGSAVVDPYNENKVYISSNFDPRNDSSLGVYELFKGSTSDRGATWAWVPITRHSVRDNLRPVVPAWDEDNTALLWLRGKWLSAQQYDAAIVGIIERNGETGSKKIYSDAGAPSLRNGCGMDSLDLSIEEGAGGSDGRWHERTGSGNNGTVIVAAEEPDGENAPLIKTWATITEPGTYDFWANFWGKPDGLSDWQIATALTPLGVQVYCQSACRTVDPAEYTIPPLVMIGDTLFLYQAYAGRHTVVNAESVYVYIDDRVLENNPCLPAGDVKRSWFDGISYAAVASTGSTAGKKAASIVSPPLKLRPVPSRSLLEVTYSINRQGVAELALFDMRGRLIHSYTSSMRQPGAYTVTFSTSRFAAGIYFCRLTAGKSAATAAIRVVR